MSKQNIIVSVVDRERLQTLINSALLDSRVPIENLNALESELTRAKVLRHEDVPSDVITMNSTVCFADLTNEEEESYTLVYPRDADAANGKISVFAPIGTALLGYRVGDVVEWAVPAGKRRLRIIAVQHDAEPVPVAQVPA